MNQETKKTILNHLNEWLEDKKLNTVDLKTRGHLPVSGRWVDSLRKSVRDKDNKGFNTEKVIELLKVLELPYFMDGSQLVVKSVGFVCGFKDSGGCGCPVCEDCGTLNPN